jgi:hypothetical protein
VCRYVLATIRGGVFEAGCRTHIEYQAAGRMTTMRDLAVSGVILVADSQTRTRVEGVRGARYMV